MAEDVRQSVLLATIQTNAPEPLRAG